jgi:hypothetical protein
MQKRDIEKELFKSINTKKIKFNNTKYKVIWQSVLNPLFLEVMQNE